MLFIKRLTCGYVAANHSCQIIRRVAQFIGEKMGLYAQIIRIINLFFSINIGYKAQSKDNQYDERLPNTANKQ